MRAFFFPPHMQLHIEHRAFKDLSTSLTQKPELMQLNIE